MEQKQVKVTLVDLEYLLDLPTTTSVISGNIEGGHLVLTLKTDIDFPDNAVLAYESNQNGSVSLTGAY